MPDTAICQVSAVDAKITEALFLRYVAIKLKSRKDEGLRDLVERRRSLKACAIALRHIGLPLSFMDASIWAEIKASEEADEFRSKFKKDVNKTRKKIQVNKKLITLI